MGDTLVVILVGLGGIALGASMLGLMVALYIWRRSGTSVAPAPKSVPTPYRSPEPKNPKPTNDPFETMLPHKQEDPFSTFEAMPHANQKVPFLEGTGGMVAGQIIKLDRPETLLGRSRVCDVQFHDPKVSRQHTLIRFYNGRYFIQDMQSSRGTHVNHQKIDTHPLQDGDEIRIGDSIVVFRHPQ